MKSFVRASALMPTAALVLACASDVKPVGDALAEDSTLALAVMGARPDSGIEIADMTTSPDDLNAAVPVVTDVPPAPAPVEPTASKPVEERKARASQSPVRARAARSRIALASAGPTQRRPVSRTTISVPSRTRQSVTRKVNAVPSRGWLLVPAGADIQLEAERKICNSNEGEGFEAVVAQDVVMANGVIIPEGAVARGEVISGTGVQPVLALDWISFGGRMYDVKTRITHTDASRARSSSYCVPEGGRIVAELTAPLRIALSE